MRERLRQRKVINGWMEKVILTWVQRSVKNRLHNELSSESNVTVKERRRPGFYVRGDETD